MPSPELLETCNTLHRSTRNLLIQIFPRKFSIAVLPLAFAALFGVVAYLIGVLVARGAMHSDPFSRTLPLAGGLALCIAGIYQLTPWKSACLKHCRDPLTLVANHLHGGRFGALRLGIHHGAFCAACCWALMLIQLVLGVMNLTVMLAVAVVIALEKLLSKGEWVARVVGLAAIAGGVVISALSVRSL
jgi:predicted metal-binding membrane protein